MRNLRKSAFLFLTVLSLVTKISSQQEPLILKVQKLTVKISISLAVPTTKDMITFTVNAQDNSGTGLKRISILVNKREVEVCLMSSCVYAGGPYPEGPLDYGAMVYDHTENQPWAGSRSIYAKKATRLAPQRKRIVGLPEKIIELIPFAEDENTQWTNGTIALNFPGEESDYSGFACYRYDSLLEDDKVYSKVLLTHPDWRPEFGLIVGIFKIKNLPEKATFKTKAGFLKEAKKSDGAEFRVFVNSNPSFYAAKQCYYDGHLDDLVLNLEGYSGQNIEIVFQVNVMNTSTQDLAVWVDPRIEW